MLDMLYPTTNSPPPPWVSGSLLEELAYLQSVVFKTSPSGFPIIAKTLAKWAKTEGQCSPHLVGLMQIQRPNIQAHMTKPSPHQCVAKAQQILPSAIFGDTSHHLNTNPWGHAIACLGAWCEYFKRLPCWVKWDQGWLSCGVTKLAQSGQIGLQKFA
jgi:hypothetical protein